MKIDALNSIKYKLMEKLTVIDTLEELPKTFLLYDTFSTTVKNIAKAWNGLIKGYGHRKCNAL